MLTKLDRIAIPCEGSAGQWRGRIEEEKEEEVTRDEEYILMLQQASKKGDWGVRKINLLSYLHLSLFLFYEETSLHPEGLNWP